MSEIPNIGRPLPPCMDQGRRHGGGAGEMPSKGTVIYCERQCLERSTLLGWR